MGGKRHIPSWRILIGGRPWEANSQAGTCLNYSLGVHLQTKKKAGGKNKQISQKDAFRKQAQVLPNVNQKLSRSISFFSAG